MTFRFDATDHSYHLGDRRLWSVTQILTAAGLLWYPSDTAEAMLRGTFVHAASEMTDRGELDWNALDPRLLPYCRAYERFIEEARPEIVLSEKPMYHAHYLYAGKPDRLVKLNGRMALIDLKSGSPHPATAIQLAAYRELVKVNEDVAASCFALYLRDDGTYRLKEENDARRGLNIFLAALTVCRWREEHLS